MGRFSGDYIDSYEKKISVYQIYRMYQDKRIVFPLAPSTSRIKKIESISKTVEAILLGIALPGVYVSERQDGSLLILEADDRLRGLIGFLEGCYPIDGLEFYPEMNGYQMEEMEQRFPKRTSWLFDYNVSFQIIEYTTPRYMHMQVGSYIERWNLTREQGVRNALYGEKLEQCLCFFEQSLGQIVPFLSKWSLNRQYMVLRILMYRFVLEEDIQTEWGENIGLQQLLDQTVECINEKDWIWREKMADALREATGELMNWNGRYIFGLEKEKGKERQARALGYLYNVIWMCRKKGCEIQWGLEQVAFDRYIWSDIARENVNTIRRHLNKIEERLR